MALSALGLHKGKLLLCSCLSDLVPMWCKKWKAKVAFQVQGFSCVPRRITLCALVLMKNYFND